jgi:DNA-binding phage protein
LTKRISVDINVNMSFERVLRKLVRKEGLRKVARELGIDPGSLYRSMMDGSNVGLNRIEAILDYFGFELKISKRKEVTPTKSKPSRSRRRKGDV